MFGSVLKNTTKNPEYRFEEIYGDYSSRFSRSQRENPPPAFPDFPRAPTPLLSSGGGGIGYYNVSLPNYLTLNGFTDFVSLVSQYYDWLHLGQDYIDPINAVDGEFIPSGYGSGYYFSPEYLSILVDYEKVGLEFGQIFGADPTGFIGDPVLRKSIMRRFVSQYAPGLINESTLIKDTGTERHIIKTLGEIRQNFYTKKSNIESIKWLFQSIYAGSNEIPEVEVYEPKRDILRLDGGVPDFNAPNLDLQNGIYFTGTGVGLFGQGKLVLHDNCWYHDYSYLLKVKNITDQRQDEAFEIVNSMFHPAGLQLIFNKENDEYVPPDDFDGTFGATETSILGNYFGYRLNDTVGLTASSGCTFDFDGDGSGDDFKSFNHPAWSDEINGTESFNETTGLWSGAVFGSINIGDFFFLSPADQSPNISSPSCT